MSPPDKMPSGGDAAGAALIARWLRGRRARLGPPDSLEKRFVPLASEVHAESVPQEPVIVLSSVSEVGGVETRKDEPDDLGNAEGHPGQPDDSCANAVTDGGVAKLVKTSLQESIEETSEWAIKTVLEIGAHCICPIAGHLVTIAFEVKEVLDDAAALDSPDGARELHVPLVHLAPGIEFEADVQLGNEGDEDGPRLSVFVVPGDGGLFGGWALERDKDHEVAGQAAPKTEQDVPEGAAVVHADLSQAVDASEDLRTRAAILRGSASRLQSQLWAMPEYSGLWLVVIYDGQADLGIWLFRPEVATILNAWGIELESDAETGLLIARLRA